MVYGSSLFLVDAIKAVASQLIVWHHLAAYSPMSEVLHPHATTLVDWLYADARIAVQAFLVVGGFLAARSLAPSPDAVSQPMSGNALLRRIWLRYLRLALPYLIALAFAIVCAALARNLASHPETPAAPTSLQVLAHILLLQDIVGVDALSAGVWYVAIDFQLYVLFALLLELARRLGALTGTNSGVVAMVLCGGMATASLLWVNRDPSLDLWAPYFFGAYGLGIFAQWATGSGRSFRWLMAMAAIVVIALAIDWRSRILVAGLTALALAVGAGWRMPLHSWMETTVSRLGRISYPVFLIHYPVSLLVGAVILRSGSETTGVHLAALFAAWGLSLATGALLGSLTESGGWLPSRFGIARWKQRH